MTTFYFIDLKNERVRIYKADSVDQAVKLLYEHSGVADESAFVQEYGDWLVLEDGEDYCTKQGCVSYHM